MCVLSAQSNEVCLPHVCQPPLLMHVHLEGEMYSHRVRDESDFPTNSQKKTLLETESTHWRLTCQCLLENGADSEKSFPVDPQISAVTEENHRQELSQFEYLSM